MLSLFAMINLFSKGDTKIFNKKVTDADMARFESGTVHAVYSTFALARDAEWSGRLFVLDMKEKGEEGIGTSIQITHKSPAFCGDEVRFVARFEELNERNEIITSFQAFCGDRLIAEGTQGQRILPKEKIDRLFDSIRSTQ